MNNETNHIYVELFEQNGERTYTHKFVSKIPVDQKYSEYAEKMAASWYGSEPDKGDGGYYYDAGEVFVRVETASLITQNDFTVLKNYLTFLPFSLTTNN